MDLFYEGNHFFLAFQKLVPIILRICCFLEQGATGTRVEGFCSTVLKRFLESWNVEIIPGTIPWIMECNIPTMFLIVVWETYCWFFTNVPYDNLQIAISRVATSRACSKSNQLICATDSSSPESQLVSTWRKSDLTEVKSNLSNTMVRVQMPGDMYLQVT